MSTEHIPTNADALSLAAKLEKFDESLTPAEKAIFRHRLLVSLADGEDVIAHRLEMRWNSGPGGVFQSWVQVDDNADPEQPLAGLDPSRWTTFASGASPATGRRIEDNLAQSPS